MKLSKNQRLLLEKLMDKYEGSKSYGIGEDYTKLPMVKTTDIYKDYDNDFADVDEQRDFETEMLELKKGGYIDIRNKRKSISRLVLKIDKIEEIYELLKRVPRKVAVKEQIDFYTSWLGKNETIDKYCIEQIDILENGKKAKYDLEVALRLLGLTEYVFNNESDILERELSIAVFGDTKLFEKEYRSKLITLLKSYGDYDELIKEIDDEKELSVALLESLNIYSNPKYVYFKGNGKITFKDGIIYDIIPRIPLAMPMDRFKDIAEFIIKDSSVITVENLASYNRIELNDSFFIYLAGYHNFAKELFINLISKQNENLKWFHFGDIDPDGFLILENLKKRTGIDFIPLNMGIDKLKTYAKYTKTLEENDIIKANGLIEKNMYVKEMKYMLDNNVKLEQEVISWEKSRK